MGQGPGWHITAVPSQGHISLAPHGPPKEPLGLARGYAVPNLCVLLALGMLLAGAGKLPVLMRLIFLSGSPINLVLTSLTFF